MELSSKAYTPDQVQLEAEVCVMWEDGEDKVQLWQEGVQPITLEGWIL